MHPKTGRAYTTSSAQVWLEGSQDVSYVSRLPQYARASIDRLPTAPFSRPRRSSHLLTESRFSSRHPILTFRSMQVRVCSLFTRYIVLKVIFAQEVGAERSVRLPRYTARTGSEACSRATLRHSSAYSHTPPLSSWRTIS